MQWVNVQLIILFGNTQGFSYFCIDDYIKVYTYNCVVTAFDS